MVREQWKRRWIEAVLEQMGSRSPEVAAEEFQASYSTLRRWSQGDFKKEPGTAYRERLAELRGQSFEDFEAWLNGVSASPERGKSWAELGREAIANPAALREFLSELDPEQIRVLVGIAISIQGERLRG